MQDISVNWIVKEVNNDIMFDLKITNESNVSIAQKD